MQPLDMEFVRAQFPAFSDPVLGKGSFFENAGGSFPCRQVVDRLTRFYTSRKVQPYGPFEASRIAGEEMDEARSRLAAMLGVDTDELSFGPSTTQNTHVLANAFRRHLNPGDVIVVTNQDHEANSGPWRRLAEDGITIREWRVDPETGHLDTAHLPALLDGARLLCFPHCSNVLGEVNDVAAICDMARGAGVRTCVDGVSYAPHGLPDVGKLGADIYLFSAYKTYGPHQGLMVIRRALGETLPHEGHDFNAGTLYKRFTPAGPDHAQVAASAGIADYLDRLYHDHGGRPGTPPAARAAAVHDLMRAHETRLLQPLLDHLAARNDIRLLGPRHAKERAPTVALHHPGQSGRNLAAALAPHGVMAGGGDFYAVRPLRAMGIDPAHGVLRMSFVHYATPADIDRLIDALDRVL